jgi:hypothetical protein
MVATRLSMRPAGSVEPSIETDTMGGAEVVARTSGGGEGAFCARATVARLVASSTAKSAA